ncbi:MAG: hypothetical protein IJ313_09935, partial [Clostridia bacterium]|nr:hypothetical protein [Clostridia bacterium]
GKSADQYALKTDTAPNSAKLGGKAPEYYLQPVNLLDNSDFRNPVNQRGQTSYTEGRHTIDRWEMWVESGIANVSLMEGYISISFGGHGTFHQKLAKGVLDLSKQYSLAIKKHGGLMMVGPAYIASNSEHDSVAVADLRDGDTMEIEWCAIYEGSYTAETLPPYVPKGYAAELAACQRYAFPLPEFVGIPGYITSEGKQFIFAVSCPPMRDAGSTKPTVSEIPQFTIRTVSGYSSIATQEAPGTPNSLVVQDYSPDSHQMTLCATFASAIGTNNTPACGQIRYGVRPLISLDL